MTLTQLSLVEGFERTYRDAPPVLAAQAWRSNGHLIADCARLGYLRSEWRTLDATYGEGTWWSVWRPDRLVTVDKLKPADLAADFRDLPFPAGTFGAVTYDPPYVVRGGRTTAGAVLADTNWRYGVGGDDEPRTPGEGQDRIYAGLDEVHRVLRPGGMALVKVQDYVSSGGLYPATFKTWGWATHTLSFELVDVALYLAPVRPQPHLTQRHFRRNVSTLFVLRKEGR